MTHFTEDGKTTKCGAILGWRGDRCLDFMTDSRSVDCPRCLVLMTPNPAWGVGLYQWGLTPSAASRLGIDPTAHPCRGAYSVVCCDSGEFQ